MFSVIITGIIPGSIVEWMVVVVVRMRVVCETARGYWWDGCWASAGSLEHKAVNSFYSFQYATNHLPTFVAFNHDCDTPRVVRGVVAG